MNWIRQAKCNQNEFFPDLFFPVGNTEETVEQIEIAKGVCVECFVVEQCLDYAIKTNKDSGVWGGKDEEERREIRRTLPKKTRRRFKTI